VVREITEAQVERIAVSIPTSNAWPRFQGMADFARRICSTEPEGIREGGIGGTIRKQIAIGLCAAPSTRMSASSGKIKANRDPHSQCVLGLAPRICDCGLAILIERF
jgi:hypothetical protein